MVVHSRDKTQYDNMLDANIVVIKKHDDNFFPFASKLHHSEASTPLLRDNPHFVWLLLQYVVIIVINLIS